MEASGSGWQRILLSSGLIEPGGGERTVRDWIVDALIFAVAVGAGLFVLGSTWDQHSTAIKVLDIVLGTVALAGLWLRRSHPSPSRSWPSCSPRSPRSPRWPPCPPSSTPRSALR